MRKIWLGVLLISMMLTIMSQPAEAQSVPPDRRYMTGWTPILKRSSNKPEFPAWQLV